MMFRIKIIIFIIFATLVLLQWLINIPRQKRYKQFWSPITALLFGLVACWAIHWGHSLAHFPIFSHLFSKLPDYIQTIILKYKAIFFDLKLIILNSLILAGFLPVKILGILTNKAAAWLKRFARLRERAQKLFEKIGLNPIKILGEEQKTGPRSVAAAYKYVPGEGVYLKPEWYYASIFLPLVSLIPLVLLLVMLVFMGKPGLDPMLKYFPEIPAISFIILFEAALFLQGPRLKTLPSEATGKGPTGNTLGRYKDLYEEYQTICPERLLKPVILPSPPQTGKGHDPNHCSGHYNIQMWCRQARSQEGQVRNPAIDCGIYCQVVENLLNGRNVLVTDAVHNDIAPFVFCPLIDFLTDGRKILMLVRDPSSISETIAWIKEGIRQIGGVEAVWKILRLDDYLQSGDEPDILVASLEAVRNDSWSRLSGPWLDHLDMVVLPEGLGIEPEQVALARSLTRSLSDLIGRKPQFLVFSKSFEGREPSIREILQAPVTEIYAAPSSSGETYCIVWRAEGVNDLQYSIIPRFTSLFAGEEIPLSLVAIRAGVDQVRLVHQQSQPWHEYVEEIRKYYNLLQDFGIPADTGMRLNDHYVTEDRNWRVPVENTAFLMVRDNENNIIKAIDGWRARGRESCFVHIIAPPYMLRDYLAANLEFFYQSDQFVSPWVPAVLESRPIAAYLLFKRLQKNYLEEADVALIIKDVGLSGYATTLEGLIKLLEETFGDYYDFGGHLEVRTREKFDLNSRRYHKVIEYRLLAMEMFNIVPEWFETWTVQDETGQTLSTIAADRVNKYYLPGQFHAFAGKLYRIEHFDTVMKTVNVSFVDPTTGTRPKIYRHKRLIRVEALNEAVSSSRQVIGQWGVARTIRRADLEVTVEGYYGFERGIDLSETAHTYYDLKNSEVIERKYSSGRLLEIAISRNDGQVFNQGGGTGFTMAVLISELLCSLFPTGYPLLTVSAALPAEVTSPDNSSELLGIFPVFQGLDLQYSENAITLYLFEDSNVELGVLEVFSQRWADAIRILEDYLAWLLHEDGPVTSIEPELNAPRADEEAKPVGLSSSYLYYGAGELAPSLDLPAVLQVLRGLIPPSDRLAPRRLQAKSNPAKMSAAKSAVCVCDFCGSEFPAAQVERLQDGRERCPECRRTAINTLQELQSLYQQARAFHNNNFRINLRKEVLLHFGSAEDISRISRLPFVATEGRDPRAVGVATCEDTAQGRVLSLYIENGSPAQATMATLVHELTHIWQYDNLEIRSLNLEEAEGLATWAEIQYLERTGARDAADSFRRELDERDDVYCHGLKLVEEIVRELDGSNPFDYFLKKYPVKLF